jgi:hypothetical protein
MQGKYYKNEFLDFNFRIFRNLAIGIGIQNFPEGRINDLNLILYSVSDTS